MKTLYLELASGISGDMFLGALLDLGVELDTVRAALSGLPLDGCQLTAERAQKSGLAGTRFRVRLADGRSPEAAALADAAAEKTGHSHAGGHAHAHARPHAPSRNFADIRTLIQDSALDPWVKERAVAVFARLAAAEGKVHGRPPEQVHFHEVGAVDSIVDIVGGCVALDCLGRPRVRASLVTEGSGFVECAHGRLPVPAPATLELLTARGIPFRQCDEPHELVTPTGAALLAELAGSFGPLPPARPLRVGYGLGTRDLHSRPNMLRALLIEEIETDTDAEQDEVAVLETNLDDASPELLGDFLERALADGALDVFHTPVQMKKNRPGVLLTVICPPDRQEEFARRLLTETSAFGVRCTRAQRRKLRRTFRAVPTPYGEITVKEGWLGERRVQAAPEFASCQAAARRAGVPLADVYAAARAAEKES